MSTRLLKLAAPVVAGLGAMAALAVPASAACYIDGWGRQVCTRPPVVYAPPPPPVYYAPPPVYYAPPAPRVVVAPAYYGRRHYGHYHGRPTFSFGFAY